MLILIENLLIRLSDRPYFSSFFLPFYISLLFLENVLLPLLFTLNWHLHDINTEISVLASLARILENNYYIFSHRADR